MYSVQNNRNYYVHRWLWNDSFSVDRQVQKVQESHDPYPYAPSHWTLTLPCISLCSKVLWNILKQTSVYRPHKPTPLSKACLKLTATPTVLCTGGGGGKFRNAVTVSGQEDDALLPSAMRRSRQRGDAREWPRRRWQVVRGKWGWVQSVRVGWTGVSGKHIHPCKTLHLRLCESFAWRCHRWGRVRVTAGVRYTIGNAAVYIRVARLPSGSPTHEGEGRKHNGPELSRLNDGLH